MVAAAAALDPQNSDAAGALAEINALETRAAEERERARVAENRARAIAPMLEMARAAETERDFVRAAWTAENILAIDSGMRGGPTDPEATLAKRSRRSRRSPRRLSTSTAGGETVRILRAR